MAYTLGKKCAKNLCKRTVVLQFIIENVVTCFFLRHSVYHIRYVHSNQGIQFIRGYERQRHRNS